MNIIKQPVLLYDDKEYMPEWLRGRTANPLGSALAGSNPAVLVMIINKIKINKNDKTCL